MLANKHKQTSSSSFSSSPLIGRYVSSPVFDVILWQRHIATYRPGLDPTTTLLMPRHICGKLFLSYTTKLLFWFSFSVLKDQNSNKSKRFQFVNDYVWLLNGSSAQSKDLTGNYSQLMQAAKCKMKRWIHCLLIYQCPSRE